jgi:hypothetical protein
LGHREALRQAKAFALWAMTTVMNAAPATARSGSRKNAQLREAGQEGQATRHPRASRRKGAAGSGPHATVGQPPQATSARVFPVTREDLVGLDAGDDIGPIRVIVEHVILDFVVVLESKIAVRALVDDEAVRRDSILGSRRLLRQRRRSQIIGQRSACDGTKVRDAR